jgi:ElaA protein
VRTDPTGPAGSATQPAEIRFATFDRLDTATLYALLRLRVDVFVVEQTCPYPELDGRDTEPGTWHAWSGGNVAPTGYLRIMEEPDGAARIGRVCVAASQRGTGLARRLMTAALDRVGDRPCVLDAQSHLAGFYASLGFEPDGPEFVEDGIPHIPMRRAGGRSGRAVPGEDAGAARPDPAPAALPRSRPVPGADRSAEPTGYGRPAISSGTERRRPV